MKDNINTVLEEFNKLFSLQENGCSDCITDSLFYNNKPIYDFRELENFISTSIQQLLAQRDEEWVKVLEASHRGLQPNYEEIGYHHEYDDSPKELLQILNKQTLQTKSSN